ncbi:hypothetical protein [uncultured Salinisphaera sp.]|uniref:hypothetical protein n=1 Tax=uncultured Salinisphaera sp. TaxID=359372 RepID=UPI0032B2FD54|tara:strand:+ start:1787 stop:2047 length:261 start_codon:yes stop_codon:yes gene_type:complete
MSAAIDWAKLAAAAWQVRANAYAPYSGFAVGAATDAATPTWPCGQCRQKLAELAAHECRVMAVTRDTKTPPFELAELLPGALRELT